MRDPRQIWCPPMLSHLYYIMSINEQVQTQVVGDAVKLSSCCLQSVKNVSKY